MPEPTAGHQSSRHDASGAELQSALHGKDVMPSEAARLEALGRYGVIDGEPLPELGRIVELARELFGTPTALVSFVDEKRQVFKARTGLDATETPREQSICAHTILSNDVLVVPDASRDPRFAANPLVTGPPGVRFYAGAPLRTPDGHNLGSLCVVSNEPRPGFAEQDKRRLSALAAMVVTELELQLNTRRAADAVAQREAALADRDRLIREIRHRVDNGLEMVRQVLALQARSAGSVEIARAFDEASSRVLAIAAVHRGLYRSGSIEACDGREYLALLIDDFRAGMAAGRPVTLTADVGVRLEPDALLPLGLAVTEFVSNAVRHGAGGIVVELRRLPEDVFLAVSDEGGGFPIGFDPVSDHKDIGMRLVSTFVGPGGLYVDPADRRRIVAVLPASAARRRAVRRDRDS